VFVRDGWAVVRYRQLNERIFRLDSLRLRGRHNQANAVAAAAIATACGISPEAIACAVETFRGVPHRLEFAGEAEGVSYYNDSIATTPQRRWRASALSLSQSSCSWADGTSICR
jgi:UDP-N-acetylmuramoylalanine--D-glutamate ligase